MNRSRWASRAHYGQEVSTSEPVYYTERVRVPFSYWAIALFFGLTFVTAVTFMLGDAVLIASTLTATALIACAIPISLLATFIVLVAVLLVRPYGLFGTHEIERL